MAPPAIQTPPLFQLAEPAAREHLEYVVAHGNKLHARTQAIRLWEEQGFPPR